MFTGCIKAKLTTDHIVKLLAYVTALLYYQLRKVACAAPPASILQAIRASFCTAV